MKQTVFAASVAGSVYLAGLLTLLFFPPCQLNPAPVFVLKLLTVCFGVLLTLALIMWGRRGQRQGRKMEYSKALFYSIVDNLDEGIAVLDHAGRLQSWSPRFSRLLGGKDAFAAGCRASEVLPESICRFIKGHDCMDEADSADLPSETIPLGDTYVNVRLLPVCGMDGSSGCALLLQDRTRQIAMEHERESLLREIHCHTDARESFLANVSHELKTPLNALFGLTHILEETDLDLRQKDLLSKISMSSSCLNERINDILYLSDLKNGSLTQTASLFRLKDLMDSLFDRFSAAAAQKNLRLLTDYRFDPELHLYLDYSWMEQLLSNLIGNACKFTDTGFVRISVRVLNEMVDTATLKFTVEDTGVGIKSGDLAHIFEDFYQAEHYLTKERQGTGLGLPICKGLADNMGGALWAESTEGAGSSFHFTVTAPKSCRKKEDGKDGQPDPAGCQSHRERVLVVEDAPLNYEVVRELLDRVAVSCDHAASGPEALDICGEKGDGYYKAVFMDIHMPVMDGYETARRLKEQGFKTPVIALTATSMDAAARTKYGDLFSDFVFKPFRHTQLYDALAPYINGLSAGGGSPAQTPEPVSCGNPYISREEAVENMGGSLALYEKHLAKFKKNYAGAADTLRNFLAAGNRQEAKRLAHSVKGLSATLGLSDLARASKALEEVLGSGGADPASLLDAFEESLKQAME